MDARAEDLARSAALLRPCIVETTGPAWRAAEADGWDMTRVVHSLAETAEQRMQRHNLAVTQALEMREAFRRTYGESGAPR